MVLIVDDDPDVLFSYQRLLERSLADVKVLTATSGQDGLRVLRGQRVDLVIADYRMPEMDGLEFLEQARVINPRIPRMMITAFPDRRLADRARAFVGPEDFLSKDVDSARIVERVARLLGRSAA